MPKERKFLPRIISAATFILLEVAALQLLYRNAELQRIWIARAAHGVMGTVWGSTQAISSYFSLKRTNEDLVLENQQLREELDGLRASAHDLRVDSLGVASGRIRGFDYIPAEVIKISRNKQHNYMILNKGFEDGIQEKSGIITRSGVVGIVDAVSAHHCYALSFQNSDISISGRFGEDGATLGREELPRSHPPGGAAPVQVRRGRHRLYQRPLPDVPAGHPARRGRGGPRDQRRHQRNPGGPVPGFHGHPLCDRRP